MYIVAWLILFGLLAAFFNDWIEQQYNPNRNISKQSQNGQKELILKPNRQHHYLSSGTINQQPVVFLLDTGATNVAIPAALATRLRLNKGRAITVQTANGLARAYTTQIKSLGLGNIQLNNISASINPGMDDGVVLLGMSALRQLEFTQKGDLLILRQ